MALSVSRTHEFAPRETLARAIHDIHLALARGFNRRVRHLGLTRPQWEVLSVLRRGLNGATQTQIAERLELGRSPVGKIIDKLQAMDLVERRPDQDDRRTNRVFLTDNARPLEVPLREVNDELQHLALNGIDDSTTRRLLETLNHILINLHENDTEQDHE